MAYFTNGTPFDKLPLFPNETKSNQSIGVVMADGLGSDGRESTSGYQKIFPIGNNFLLGTGPGDKIFMVAEELSSDKDLKPKELADKILDLSKELFVNPYEVLNFIVVGKNESQIEGYRLIMDRYNKPIKFNTFMPDGSGSFFVSKAMERDEQRGLLYRDMRYMNIADFTSTLFDFGHVAKKSAGVNDEFQYGFILPEGNASLFDPRVNLRAPSKEYVDSSEHLNFEKKIWNNKKFSSLSEALGKSYNLNYEFNMISLAMQSGNYDLKKLQKRQELVLTEFQETRDHLKKIITGYVVKHNSKV